MERSQPVVGVFHDRMRLVHKQTKNVGMQSVGDDKAGITQLFESALQAISRDLLGEISEHSSAQAARQPSRGESRVGPTRELPFRGMRFRPPVFHLDRGRHDGRHVELQFCLGSLVTRKQENSVVAAREFGLSQFELKGHIGAEIQLHVELFHRQPTTFSIANQ